MGMICCLQPIAESEIDGLLADPSQINDLLENGDEAGIDLDKSWHGIHYLLTGNAWEGEEPLCFLVSGGEQIGEEDVGYGPARLLRPEVVKQVDVALRTIDRDEMRRRYDPAAMAAADVYPSIWDRQEEREENLEYILENYGQLRQFVGDAAKKGNGIIVSIM